MGVTCSKEASCCSTIVGENPQKMMERNCSRQDSLDPYMYDIMMKSLVATTPTTIIATTKNGTVSSNTPASSSVRDDNNEKEKSDPTTVKPSSPYVGQYRLLYKYQAMLDINDSYNMSTDTHDNNNSTTSPAQIVSATVASSSIPQQQQRQQLSLINTINTSRGAQTSTPSHYPDLLWSSRYPTHLILRRSIDYDDINHHYQSSSSSARHQHSFQQQQQHQQRQQRQQCPFHRGGSNINNHQFHNSSNSYYDYSRSSGITAEERLQYQQQHSTHHNHHLSINSPTSGSHIYAIRYPSESLRRQRRRQQQLNSKSTADKKDHGNDENSIHDDDEEDDDDDDSLLSSLPSPLYHSQEQCPTRTTTAAASKNKTNKSKQKNHKKYDNNNTHGSNLHNIKYRYKNHPYQYQHLTNTISSRATAQNVLATANNNVNNYIKKNKNTSVTTDTINAKSTTNHTITMINTKSNIKDNDNVFQSNSDDKDDKKHLHQQKNLKEGTTATVTPTINTTIVTNDKIGVVTNSSGGVGVGGISVGTPTTVDIFQPFHIQKNPPKETLTDWLAVSEEHQIYIVDVGLSAQQCDHIVQTTELSCKGNYAAYTYAKQTLGCREFPQLAQVCYPPVHNMLHFVMNNFYNKNHNHNYNCYNDNNYNVRTSNNNNNNNNTSQVSSLPLHPLQLDDREPHVVKYDVTKKERQKLDMHTDKSEWTFLIALSNGCGLDYDGGGTYFECINSTVHIQRGHALLFPGKLRHCGQKITRGLRYILAAFLVDKKTQTTTTSSQNNISAAMKSHQQNSQQQNQLLLLQHSQQQQQQYKPMNTNADTTSAKTSNSSNNNDNNHIKNSDDMIKLSTKSSFKNTKNANINNTNNMSNTTLNTATVTVNSNNNCEGRKKSSSRRVSTTKTTTISSKNQNNHKTSSSSNSNNIDDSNGSIAVVRKSSLTTKLKTKSADTTSASTPRTSALI